MKSAIEFKADKVKTLVKRKNGLTKRYETTLPTEIPLAIKSELDLLENLLSEFTVDEEIFAKLAKTINIKNSRDEEWYFQQMKHWAQRHPQATNGQYGKSTLYKFALHFFVENIALNSANAGLNILDLAQKINITSSQKHDAKSNAIMANIEEVLGLLLTMQQRQLDYIPEVVDQQTGIVQYAINPINKTEFQQFGAPTEINPNTDLGQTYLEYKKIRSRDKQLIKKYHQTIGQLDND